MLNNSIVHSYYPTEFFGISEPPNLPTGVCELHTIRRASNLKSSKTVSGNAILQETRARPEVNWT